MKKILKYGLIVYFSVFIIYNLTSFLLVNFTSFRIVKADNHILNLPETIVDIQNNQYGNGIITLTKNGTLYFLNEDTLNIESNLSLPKNITNAYTFYLYRSVSHQTLTILDKKDGDDYLLEFKYYTNNYYRMLNDNKTCADFNFTDKEPKIYNDFSKKLNFTPISIASYSEINYCKGPLTPDLCCVTMLDRNNNVYYVQQEESKNIGQIELPFKFTSSKDNIIRKNDHDHYTILDQKKRKIHFYAKNYAAKWPNGRGGHSEDNEWNEAHFTVEDIPRVAVATRSFAWAGNYRILPRGNYRGKMLVLFENKEGVFVYDIYNSIFTSFLHEINKVSAFILSIPFWPLGLFFGRQ